MQVKANAKINLALDVVDRKSNGYHELDMIMVSLELADNVEIEFNEEDEIIMGDTELSLENNTVYKALKLFKEHTGIIKNFKIKVEKNIPMQAGLAGGSSDAAAVLIGLNEITNSKLDLDELMFLGAKIGADVPFCLFKKLARVKGIGEKITKINNNVIFDVLLVKPKTGVSTKEAFELLDIENLKHPAIDSIVNKLENNESFLHLIDNSLEQSALKLNLDIYQIKKDLKSYGLKHVLMSGSGSCVFAIDNKDKLFAVYNEIKDKYDFVCLTKTI